MKTLNITCTDEGASVVAEVLQKLQTISDKSFRRVIRIGGNRIILDARNDDAGILDVEIDGSNLDTWLGNNPTPDSVLGITPVVPATPASPISDGAASIATNDSDLDEDSSLPHQSAPATTDADAEEEVIRDATLDAISGSQMFTAYDITSDAKETGTVQRRHNTIKHIIHDMWDNGEMPGYQRTLFPIRGTSQSAFLYHPNGTDADDYVQVRDAVTSDEAAATYAT